MLARASLLSILCASLLWLGACEDATGDAPGPSPQADLGLPGDARPPADAASDQGRVEDSSTALDLNGAPDTTAEPDLPPAPDQGPADLGPDDQGPDDQGPPDQGPADLGLGDQGPPPPPRCEGALQPLEHADALDATFRRGPYLQSVGPDSVVVVWLDFAGQRPPDPEEPAAPEGEGDPGADQGPPPVDPDLGPPADAGPPADLGPPPLPEEGCVELRQGEEPGLERCALPDAAGQYELRFDGLQPGADFEYSVRVGERRAGPFTARLAPATPEPARLLVFSDSHVNPETVPLIAQAGLAAGVHLAVEVGDMVGSPTESQWDAFFDEARALLARVPFWPVIGNHENYAESYFHAFVTPGAAQLPTPPEAYYSLRWGSLWIGVLELEDFLLYDLFGGQMPMPEVSWLEEELASEAAQSAQWRLLFLHQPPWARGWGHCDGYRGEPSLRNVLLPMAVAGGVHALFSGHVHGWERGEYEGMVLVTTGGAGGGLDEDCGPLAGLPEPWFTSYQHQYSLVDADCERLSIEARSLDGELIDRVELLAQP